MARKTPFQKDLENSKKTGTKKNPIKKIDDALKYFTGKKFTSYKKKNMGGAIMKNRGGMFKGTY